MKVHSPLVRSRPRSRRGRVVWAWVIAVWALSGCRTTAPAADPVTAPQTTTPADTPPAPPAASPWISPDALLPGATARIGSKAFVTAGRKIAVSNEGHTLTDEDGLGVVEWDIDGRQRTLAADVRLAAGQYLDDGTVRFVADGQLWTFSEAKVTTKAVGCSRAPALAAFSADGRTVVCLAARDGDGPARLAVIDAETAAEIRAVEVDAVETLAVSNDRVVIVGTKAKILAFSGTPLAPAFDLPRSGGDGAFAIDEARHDLVIIDHARSEVLRQPLAGDASVVTSLALGEGHHPTGFGLLSTDGSVALGVADAQGKTRFEQFAPDGTSTGTIPFDAYVVDSATSPNGERVAAIGASGAVVVVNRTTWSTVALGHRSGDPLVMHWLPTSGTLLVGNSNGVIETFDITGLRRAIGALTRSVTTSLRFALSPDERWVAATNAWVGLTVFDAATLEPRCRAPLGGVDAVLWHDDKLIVLGSEKSERASATTFDLDCRVVSEVTYPGMLKIAEREGDLPGVELVAPGRAVKQMAFAPKTLRLIPAAPSTPAPETPPMVVPQHPRSEFYPAHPLITPDRTFAAFVDVVEDSLGNRTQLVRIENVVTREEVAAWSMPPSADVTTLALHPAGKGIAVADHGTILLYGEWPSPP